jgi:hypothetical protein
MENAMIDLRWCLHFFGRVVAAALDYVDPTVAGAQVVRLVAGAVAPAVLTVAGRFAARPGPRPLARIEETGPGRRSRIDHLNHVV